MSDPVPVLAPSVTSTAAPILDANSAFADVAEHDLKRRTAHGAVISAGAQAALFVVRTGSMMILARLLLPKEFGLVGMVTAFTGFLGLFRDAGLSMAAVQRVSITKAQTSTLFWINVAVGAILALLCVAFAPVLAAFYHEPRLTKVGVGLGAAFLFNGLAAQHRAMLQRRLRFATLSAIDVISLLFSTAIGIASALAGFGYWALVAMAVAQPFAAMVGLWIAAPWMPGRFDRSSGVRSMLWFGGTITLNSVVMYFAYNADKVLLGRFWGPEVLGIYGRAYQLINLPTENLNSTLGSIAFPALSRVQGDPERLRRYFLKGYSCYLVIVMPITVACALFAGDIVRFFLGDQWAAAAKVFRLMTPTIMVFALVNPLAWLMLAVGRAERSLKIALVIAPIIVLSYVLGLRYGANGVATGFSIAMLALVIPIVWWARHGTLVSGKDVLEAFAIPFGSVFAGAATVWLLSGLVNRVQAVFPRLVLESSILFGIYLMVLLFGMKQKSVYTQLLADTGLWRFPRGSGSS